MACSAGTPNRPQASTKPPSWTPIAPGTMKPRLRASWPRLSITSASASPASTPRTRSAAQASSVPRSQEARCAAALDHNRRGARWSRRTDSCSPAIVAPSPAAEARPVSFGARRSTKRNSPQRCAARKPSAMAPQSAVAADAQAAAPSHWCGSRISNATPTAAKADCAASSVARSTATLAVAGAAPVPRRTSRWTRTNSPPTCATGRRAFTESRIHRIRTRAAHPGRLGASISGAQPKAANRICGGRKASTASMPQPAAPSRAKTSAGSLAATSNATAARPTRRVTRADRVTRRPVRPVPPQSPRRRGRP